MIEMKLMVTFAMLGAACVWFVTDGHRTLVVETFLKRTAFVCVLGAAISVLVMVWRGP